MPFMDPTISFANWRSGTSRATGLPFLVIWTLSPVAATSSITLRHLALNSEAFIVRMTTPVTMVMSMVR